MEELNEIVDVDNSLVRREQIYNAIYNGLYSRSVHLKQTNKLLTIEISDENPNAPRFKLTWLEPVSLYVVEIQLRDPITKKLSSPTPMMSINTARVAISFCSVYRTIFRNSLTTKELEHL